MASLDHRGNPTRFPGDGNSPKAIIDREFNYYGEDFYFYSGGVITSARTLIGGGVPPNIVLQNTGGFTAGRIPYAAANGFALVDSANLTFNGTTLDALNLEVNGGDFTVFPGVTTLNSAITRINNNNFTMPQFAGPDQYKLLWVSNGATSSVGTTPYTMPPTAGGLPPNGRRILQSNGSNYVNSGYGLPTSVGTSGKIMISDATDYVNTPYSMPLSAGPENTFIRSDNLGNFVNSTYALPPSGAPFSYAPLISTPGVGVTDWAPWALPNYDGTAPTYAALASVGSVLGFKSSATQLEFVPTVRSHCMCVEQIYKMYIITGGTITSYIKGPDQNSYLQFGAAAPLAVNLVFDLRGLVGDFRVLPLLLLNGFGTDLVSYVRLTYNATDFATQCPPATGTQLKEWKNPNPPSTPYYTQLRNVNTNIVLDNTYNGKSLIETGNAVTTDSSLITTAQSVAGNQLLTLSVVFPNIVATTIQLYGLVITSAV